MAIPLDRMTIVQMQAENRALRLKEKEAKARREELAAEIHKRQRQIEADRKVGVYTNQEIEEMESALHRAKARRAQRDAATGGTGPAQPQDPRGGHGEST